MKTTVLLVLGLVAASTALPNTPPTPLVLSANMRPDSTLMDVVYRVNDPDDATVNVRVLAFADGVRSFETVIRPMTFVEGTAALVGDNIPANTDHTLTWDVAADLDLDLVELTFEVLSRDGRGLLQIDWITIPEAGARPELTISKGSFPDASVLDALFWQYANADPGLVLQDGLLRGSDMAGSFTGIALADDDALQSYGIPYVLKSMDLDAASGGEMFYAATNARAGLIQRHQWHAVNRPYSGMSIVVSWVSFVSPGPADVVRAKAMSAGNSHGVVLREDGSAFGWGLSSSIYAPPPGLTGLKAVAAGYFHNLGLLSNGTVVAWGANVSGETNIPPGLGGVTAIAAGRHSLALRNDGTVAAWGLNDAGQTIVPEGLSGVAAIAATFDHSLALTSNGTVVAWGNNQYNQSVVPAELTNVVAIAAGGGHSLALKDDGTLIGWGRNQSDQITIPTGLNNVIAIAAGTSHSVALKADGTVVTWGDINPTPAGLSGVTAIAASGGQTFALKTEDP